MFGNKKPAPDGETAQAQPEALAPEAGTGDPASREAELEAELAKLKDQMLRALAEAENTRRRTEREIEDTRKYAASSFAREMLPVADNLRRALEAVPAAERESSAALKGLLIGVEATERQLLGAMDKLGIKPVDVLGKPFDPNFHQVMFEVETADQAPGTVVQVMQVGYVIHDRLLRPALVGTAKPPASGGVDEQA